MYLVVGGLVGYSIECQGDAMFLEGDLGIPRGTMA